MNYTRVSAAIFVAALLISPLAASADTLSDLQSRIDALLSELANLQGQMQQQQSSAAPASSSSASTVGTTSALSVACPVISRTVGLGASGGDVSQLQTFLAQQGVYSDEITGYFGVKTQAAVQAWQAEQGIVSNGSPDSTGWGVFGRRSQSWLARLCPGTTTPSPKERGSFSASVTSGTAPLSVRFTVTVPSPHSDTYMIAFGDGTTQTLSTSVVCAFGTSFAAGNCPDVRGASHTYAAVGSYTAVLYRQSANAGACYGSAACGDQIASTVITVNAAPVACVTLDCPQGSHAIGPSCSTQQACVSDSTSTPTTSLTPVVTAVHGPASLELGQTGVWTIEASVGAKADQNLRYSVVWGDEPVLDRLTAFAAGASATAVSGTFTHAYSMSGTFTPLFTVANSAGSSQASASVQVGSSTPSVCPVYSMQACPVGSTNGPGTTGSDGCYRPGPCVPTGGGASLSVTPSSGAAPLTAHFTGKIPGASYLIDYGDGSQPEIQMIAIDCAPTSPNCAQGYISSIDKTHVYTQQGTYTVKLSGGSYSASATVTVTGGTASSGVTASVAQGSTKVTISAPMVAQKMQQCVYSVGFFGASGNGLSVDWGDGSTSPTNSSSSQGLSCTSDVTSHVYAVSGTYTIKVTSWHPGPTDMAVTDWTGSATVSVTGGLTPDSNVCPAIAYQMPLCTTGQRVASSYTSTGCPAPSVCVPVPSICPTIAYQMPLCPAGQHVESQYGDSGCPVAPICVQGAASTLISSTGKTAQTASALSALQAALERLIAGLSR